MLAGSAIYPFSDHHAAHCDLSHLGRAAVPFPSPATQNWIGVVVVLAASLLFVFRAGHFVRQLSIAVQTRQSR